MYVYWHFFGLLEIIPPLLSDDCHTQKQFWEGEGRGGRRKGDKRRVGPYWFLFPHFKP